MAVRVTQLYREYDGADPPGLRVTQLYREYDGQDAAAGIRVTQLYREYDATVIPPVQRPELVAQALSFRRASITLSTPGEEALSHRLHRSTTPGFTPDSGNQIASGLSATSFTYEDAGLAGGTTYYYLAVAVTAGDELVGDEVTVTTPTQLVLFSVGLTSAELRHAEDSGLSAAGQVQYQSTLATDPTFASPVDDVVRTGSERYVYTISGRPTGTAHLTRARVRTSSSAAWEPWTSGVPWATLSEDPSPITGGAFTFPPYSYPQRGAAAVFSWVPGETVTGVEISDDLGTTWDAVPGWTQDGVVLDTTGYADGPYILRVLRVSGCHLYHGGFLIDNANAASYEDDFFVSFAGPRPAMAKYWEPSYPRWVLVSGFLKNATGHIGAGKGSFGPIDPPELTAVQDVIFMGECASSGTGKGFSWDRCQAGEVQDFGLVVLGAGSSIGGDAIGIRVGMRHYLLSPALGAGPDPTDAYRYVGVAQASSETYLSAAVGPVSGTILAEGGWHDWQEPCTAGMSWTQMKVAGAALDGSRLRPYQFLLWVTHPDPIGTPHRIRIRARLDGPDAWACGGRRQTLIDETVDVLDGDGEPYVFQPGHIAFYSNKTPGNRAEDSGRFLIRYSAVPLEAAVPEPPPEDVPLLANACDLVLEVFEDDRETVKWSVGTGRTHEVPYLVMPERYAEQELDAAAGTATLGTITVVVVDKAQTPGDQDSGWMTQRLADLGLADVQGRRARLTRFVNVPAGMIPNVVIDGVAGSPRLDPSYAAFSLEIRDTRETERKVRLTQGNRATTLLPHGVVDGYGFNPDTLTYLIDPSSPLLGRFLLAHNDAAFHLAGNTGAISLFSDPGNPAADRTIPDVIFEAMQGTTVVTESGTFDDYRVSFQGLAVLWRAAGSSDPWTEIGESLVIDGEYHPGFDALPTNLVLVRTLVPGTGVRAESIAFGDSRDVPQLPADNQEIELLIVSRKPASDATPIYFDGLTLGELVQGVYDGLYSPRNPDGTVRPTGILYDAAAVLAMQEPVRIRLTQQVADARAWLEKVAYAVAGWMPALDAYGRISPVSRIPPTDLAALPLLTNAITAPTPDWDAGKRIINLVRLSYHRDYRPTDPDTAETPDGLRAMPVTLEFLDPASIARNGEQVLDLDGAAFRAVGEEDGAPILGTINEETAWQLGQLADLHILNRYSLGAPSFTVPVMRSAYPDLRAGSWVRVNLSWLPDYVTQKRGLVALCQVMAMNDLDCVWLNLTLEVVTPLDLGS